MTKAQKTRTQKTKTQTTRSSSRSRKLAATSDSELRISPSGSQRRKIIETLLELPIDVLEEALRIARDRQPRQLSLLAEDESHSPAKRESHSQQWPHEVVVFTDGACRGNPGPSAVGVCFQTVEGEELEGLSEAIGRGTNNEAEYLALVRALEVGLSRGVQRLTVKADSQLMVRQMQGLYQVKSESIRPLFERAKDLARRFEAVRYEHVPREENREADRLANLALDEER